MLLGFGHRHFVARKHRRGPYANTVEVSALLRLAPVLDLLVRPGRIVLDLARRQLALTDQRDPPERELRSPQSRTG